MAVQWDLIKLPISTDLDFVKIRTELSDRKENGWDLEHIVQSDGSIIMFFKKRQ